MGVHYFSPMQGTGMQFYAIKANDVAGFNIRPFLEPTAAYIDQALTSGGKFPIPNWVLFSTHTRETLPSPPQKKKKKKKR